MRSFWFVIGLLSVLLGTAGIVLPLLPTVPFLLLAAFAFAKSSPRAHDWLVNHPKLGPPIEDWNKNGAIRTPAKIAASLCIVAGFVISLFLGVPLWALLVQLIVLSAVSIFIWTRPNA